MTFIVEYPQNLISMKTTQPKKGGRPLGSKNKFKDNPFVKKYKEELNDKGTTKDKVTCFQDEFYHNANQVKSWKRGAISETVNLTYIFLAFIIGFSLCAVVMTPIIISSI